MVSYNRRVLLKTAGVAATFGGLSSVDGQRALTGTASAATTERVIDSFEDQSLAPYYGDTSSFGFTSATSVDGSYALENSVDGRDSVYSNDGDGLANYPTQGDRFEFHVWVDTVGSNWNQSIFHWAVQDADNYYACRVNWRDNRLDIGKTENGSATDVNTTSVSFDLQPSTWYRVVVEWDDGDSFGGNAGDMTVTIHDASSDGSTTVSGNDSMWAGGGVGWTSDWYNGETGRFDYAAIEEQVSDELVIDSFEDSDLNEYYGDTSSFGFTSGTSVDGSYALENTADGRENIYSNPGDGLDNYPVQGDRFEFHVWVDTVGSNWNQSIFHWAVQDADNYYACRVNWRDNRLDIGKTENGSTGDLQTGSISFDLQPSTWYRVEVEWDDGDSFGGNAGDMTVTIHDANSDDSTTLSGTDTTWSDGGVGWASDRYNGETARYDYAAISQDAGATSIVDTFEDGDLAEYTAGDTGTWTITSDSHSGDYAAASDSSSPQYLTSPEGNGLNNYPQQGDEFEFWIKCDTINSGDFNLGGVMFGSRPNDANYRWIARVRWHQNRIQIRCQDDVDGTLTSASVDIDFTLQENTWYRCEVRWDDGSTFGGSAGDAEVEIYDSNGTGSTVASGHDDKYASGGFGLMTDRYNGEVTVVDDVKLINDDGSSGGGGDVTVVDDFEDMDLSPYTVVSGNEVQWQFTDASEAPIGGGYFYDNKVYPSEADYSVSSYTELESALDSASSGDVVYIVDDIELPKDARLSVPTGVTLAGDRGIAGSEGPTVYCPHEGSHDNYDDFAFLVSSSENGGQRFTGFRLIGPNLSWSPDQDAYGGADTSEWDDARQPWMVYGIYAMDGNPGIEVDNMEVGGWGQACIAPGSNGDEHIHHNNVYRATRHGQGYGIAGITSPQDSPAHVEYNRVSGCRHHTSGEEYYTIENNIFESPLAGNVTDAHPTLGEGWFNNNTFTATYTDCTDHGGYFGGDRASCIIIREEPDVAMHADWNWFYNWEEPRAGNWPDASISQHGTSSLTNMDIGENNQYGHDARPSRAVGSVDGRQLREQGQHALAAYAGGHYSDSADMPMQIQSTSGLNAYPSAGDTIRFWFRIEQPYAAWFARFLFGVQTETEDRDMYELEMTNDTDDFTYDGKEGGVDLTRQGSLELQVDEGGTDTVLGSTGIEWKAMVPYRITIDWPSDPANNGMSVDISEEISGDTVQSFTATPDDTWTDGGIGFNVNSSPSILFDDVEIV